jgi:chorismate mutase
MGDDPELAGLRAAIDRTNRELCEVLQRRARLVRAVAARKRALGLALVDPARERAMLAAMLDDAGEGFDRAELRQVLRGLLARYRGLCVRAGSEG